MGRSDGEPAAVVVSGARGIDPATVGDLAPTCADDRELFAEILPDHRLTGGQGSGLVGAAAPGVRPAPRSGRRKGWL